MILSSSAVHSKRVRTLKTEFPPLDMGQPRGSVEMQVPHPGCGGDPPLAYSRPALSFGREQLPD
jgi:hypothetical protein